MFKKKLLVLLMMSLSGSAFASFNPFDVFNASNDTQQNASAGDQSSQSQNATMPTSAPKIASASQPAVAQKTSVSPYVQAPSLAAPATAKNAQLVSPATQQPVMPTNPSASKGAANTMAVPTRASQPSPANHFTPGPGFGSSNSAPSGVTLGSVVSPSNNNSQPPMIGGDSILKVLNTINNNMVTWKTQSDQNKVAAGAQLVPTTPQNLQDFLLNQSGLSSFLHVPLIADAVSSPQKTSVLGFLLRDQGTSTSKALLLLTPFTKNDVPQTLSPPSSSTDQSTAISESSPNYAYSYVQSLMKVAPSQVADSDSGGQVYDLINYAINQIASQTKLVAPGSDSLMASLQRGVNTPFRTQSQINGSVSWLQQLQTASSPQLLRMIAILLAAANQMHYIQLQNQETMMVLQTAQVAEAAAENQRLVQSIAGQAQTNALLQKIYDQLLKQNSKK